ncbi:hypothetical protein Ddye_015699 [Dipteronia dyeriana]|uniref:General transcription factor 3C polypeptide 3 n=1 Tax=Dipteronia dyeriana TaxID=168575 RepID=A0AAD9WZS8_9ROSI|nr:hypothetical protein Ddye_015699 [Dipteronia dyeriana]
MEETMDFEYDEDFEEENREEEDVLVDDEDDEYVFRFKSGVNPLDLTENNASGLQVYQQFERLEYEALASRKRKAIAATRSEEDVASKSMYEFMEAINYGGFRRKSRKLNNTRGRRKGTKNKLNPQVTRLLGEATLHYAHGRFEQAISVLNEVIRVSPNTPDSYQTLGLVYKELGDNRKTFDYHVIAAVLTRTDSSLWKQLFAWCVEKGDTAQAKYCLCKAVGADPKDVDLRFHLASFYVELGDYQRAAESYKKIQKLCPEDVEAIKAGAKLYLKCSQLDHSTGILEEYLKGHPSEADLSVLDLLLAILLQNNSHEKALHHIEHAHMVYFSGIELPLKLKIKAGICYLYLRNMEKAEIYFSVLKRENANDHADLFTEVADSFMSLEHYNSALKYYCMLEANAGADSGYLHLKMAQCYLSLKERGQAIKFFNKALHTFENNIDARLTLASLLLEDAREDEATALLSPPKSLNSVDQSSDKSSSWWLNEKIIMKLCHIYRAKGMPEDFIDTIFPLVHESLCAEALRQKVKVKKRLTRSILNIRVDACNTKTDSILCGIRPIAPKSVQLKASRAKKLLEKKDKLKQEKKALADAAGVDWHSDDSDDEPPQDVHFDPPLPNLLKDEDHQYVIIDVCKALISLQRYEEASDIIDLSLRLAYIKLPLEKKEQLRALGAQMAYDSADPKHGFDSARYILHQHPYSLAAWNCYYKVISRLGKSNSKHSKFSRYIRAKHKDCIPPIIIAGHQFTMASHHQDAAKDYLEAYRLLPDDPLVNLCVGTALINLALGFRLQNKHQCIAQGLAFLYNNVRLCENSQEALYNVARACHHVGLVSLAATYYEKVLVMKEKDYPIPRHPNKNPDLVGKQESGYCDLRREAAYNLHLIYKKSGAVDLARQLLKDFCTF